MMKPSVFLLACLMVLAQSDFAAAAPSKTSAGTTKRAPVRRKTGTSRYRGQTVKRNADGSIEVFDSGPSGVLPAGGGDYSYADDQVKHNSDGSVEASGSGPSGSLGSSSTSDDVPSSVPVSGPMETPDGMKVIRNPDGSVEVSDSGPSGVLPGYAPVSRPRTTRRTTHQPQRKPVSTAVTKPAATAETKPAKTSAPKTSPDEWLPPELGGTDFGTTPKKK